MENRPGSQFLAHNLDDLSQSDFDYTTSEEQTTSNPQKKPRRTRKRDSSEIDRSQTGTVNKKDPTTKMMLADIMSSISGMSTKVDCLVTQVKEVEDALRAVNQNLVNLKTDLELKIQNHDSRLEFLEAQVQSISDATPTIDSNKDFIYAEMNKINLILSGMNDSATELQQPLTSELERILRHITTTNIKIDCAYRLGKYQPNRNQDQILQNVG
jgi:chromosome segregation ATPase